METDTVVLLAPGPIREEDRARVRAFITRSLDRPVRDSEDFFATSLVSSLFGMQLITFIEKSFAVEVTDDDLVLDHFLSIDNICRFVQRKRNDV